ncbi:MAG: hypothetical protein U5L96_16965 [Owenweeksia sp.]|nr:hypothetical protein [Owenweeksia sp.]
MGGLQYPDVGEDRQARQNIALLSRLHYSLSYLIYSNDKWQYFAGLMSYNSGDYRNHNRYQNSASNYTALLSMGPVITAQRSFAWLSQKWGLQYQLGLPVGTYDLRPGYVNPF